jgi:hypothetical protein
MKSVFESGVMPRASTGCLSPSRRQAGLLNNWRPSSGICCPERSRLRNASVQSSVCQRAALPMTLSSLRATGCKASDTKIADSSEVEDPDYECQAPRLQM